MNINIGDKNKIKNSNIGHQFISNNGGNEEPPKQTLLEKHPILISVLISLVTGFILLFSFWEKLIDRIESFFK